MHNHPTVFDIIVLLVQCLFSVSDEFAIVEPTNVQLINAIVLFRVIAFATHFSFPSLPSEFKMEFEFSKIVPMFFSKMPFVLGLKALDSSIRLEI